MKDLVFHLRNELRIIQHVLLVFLAVAFLFTLLTQSLSREYFVVISLNATGGKAESSVAPVVWMAYPALSDLLTESFRIDKSSGWENHNGVFVSRRNQPAELRLTGYFRRTAKLEFIETPYAGQMQLEINGKSENLDFFAIQQSTKQVPLDGFLSPKEEALFPVFFRFLHHLSKNLLFMIVLSVALYPIYRRIPTVRLPSLGREEATRIRKSQKYAIVISIFVFSVLVWGFYPGVMTDDSVDQYSQAVRFQFNDWHPPVFAALWSVANRIIEGPGGMFFFHFTMLCFSAFLLSLVAIIKNKKIFFLPLIAILFPVVSCISFYIVKDISFAYSLLLAFSLWYFWRTTGKLSKPGLLVIFALLFYASSVRLNAVTAVLPLSFLFLQDFTSKRAAILGSLIISILCLLGSGYLTYRGLMARRSHVSQVIMAHDLMSIYNTTGRNYFPEDYLSKDRLNQLMKQFSPLDSNATTWIEQPFLRTDSQTTRLLRNQWRKAIVEEPKVYLVHRWTVFKNFLVAVDPWLYNYHFPASWNSGTRPLFLQQNFPGKIYRKYGVWLRENVPLLFEGLSYLIALLAIFVFSVRNRIMGASALALSGLVYLLPYFFIAPGSDYRYTYWPVCAVLLSLYVLWIEGTGN